MSRRCPVVSLTLNHRLITVVPPGQIAGVVSCRDWRVLSHVGIGGVVSCRHRSMQMLIDRAEAHLPIPAGISVISRWLSEATPPEHDPTRNKPIPEGLQDEEDEAPNDFKFHDEEFWHPSGMQSLFGDVVRWCRCAQPPANHCCPSGTIII